MPLQIDNITGSEISAIVPDLAKLRIEVFRDWPYLYDGTFDYERNYLSNFVATPGSVIVVARDGERIIGAATATPLGGHADGLAAPFAAQGYAPKSIFYCGESVLMRAYRGRGVGHVFFDRREAHGRALGGFTHATFCSVVRRASDPRKPADYRPLDDFWRKRGYAPVPGLVGTFEWRDVGDGAETAKPMQYWMKPL
ncbi:MAG: GNAT family N-acetyltransferase [Proteobacteria bacterium]|nr:GNAT family N-acetyltransferase [Pseudomonadota bacterium]